MYKFAAVMLNFLTGMRRTGFFVSIVTFLMTGCPTELSEGMYQNVARMTSAVGTSVANAFKVIISNVF